MGAKGEFCGYYSFFMFMAGVVYLNLYLGMFAHSKMIKIMENVYNEVI